MSARVFLLLVGSLFLAGCSETPASLTVTLKDDRFQGGDQKVGSGDVVEFRNEDSRPHTVSVHKVGDPDNSTVKDSVVNPGGETRFTPLGQGTYKVYCKYHGRVGSGMHMVLTAT